MNITAKLSDSHKEKLRETLGDLCDPTKDTGMNIIDDITDELMSDNPNFTDELATIYNYLESAKAEEVSMLRKVRKHFTETINKLERKERFTAVLSELEKGRVGIPATIIELEKIK